MKRTRLAIYFISVLFVILWLSYIIYDSSDAPSFPFFGNKVRIHVNSKDNDVARYALGNLYDKGMKISNVYHLHHHFSYPFGYAIYEILTDNDDTTRILNENYKKLDPKDIDGQVVVALSNIKGCPYEDAASQMSDWEIFNVNNNILMFKGRKIFLYLSDKSLEHLH